jgi:hypothetical protein
LPTVTCYNRRIVGVVTNTTNRRLSYLAVIFNLYDGNALIGNAIDSVYAVEPGEVWKFAAYVAYNATSAQFLETRATAAE